MQVSPLFNDKMYREIAENWTNFHFERRSEEAAIPDFLKDTHLAALIAHNSNIIVQIMDMRKFKSIYVSPNVSAVTGFSPQEINERGVWQWFKNLSLREFVFQYKNSQLIHQQLRKRQEKKPYMHSFLLNSGIRTKTGEQKRILSSNFTIDWDEKGNQKYHLFLWKEATHLFKSEEVIVRHKFGLENPSVWCYHTHKGKFVNQDLMSDREKEILTLLEKGKISKEISEDLNISTYTVDNHRKKMIQALQVSNTSELIEVSKWLGLV